MKNVNNIHYYTVTGVDLRTDLVQMWRSGAIKKYCIWVRCCTNTEFSLSFQADLVDPRGLRAERFLQGSGRLVITAPP